jgi:hypothetical protein
VCPEGGGGEEEEEEEEGYFETKMIIFPELQIGRHVLPLCWNPEWRDSSLY